jgi:hypothetical protein
MTGVVFGPQPPTLDDLSREFTRWHLWTGVNDRLYARLLKSSPPIVVGAATPLGLRARIAEAGKRIS